MSALMDYTMNHTNNTVPVIELSQIPTGYSFSKRLAGKHQTKLYGLSGLYFRHHGQPLKEYHWITLGLSEEARLLERGRFYNLPVLRSMRDRPISRGQAWNVLFRDEEWSDADCQAWDAMNWGQRLDSMAAAEACKRSGEVIPIYAVIAEPVILPVEEMDVDDSTVPPVRHQDRMSAGIPVEGVKSDLAPRVGILNYLRPDNDMATYMIHYEGRGRVPLVCMSKAAHHHSVRELLPPTIDNSVSPSDRGPIRPESQHTQLARVVVDHGKVENNLGVVVRLLEAYNQPYKRFDFFQDTVCFGDVKVSWNDVEEKMIEDEVKARRVY